MNANTNRKRSTVMVSPEMQEKLGYACHVIGKTKTAFLDEAISPIYDVLVNFKDANLSFETSMLQNTITITVSGRSRVINGSFPIEESATKQEADKKLKRALTQQIKAKKGVD